MIGTRIGRFRQGAAIAVMASAATAGPPLARADDHEGVRAKALFDKGVAHSRARRFEDAARAFQASLAVQERPSTLRNLAIVLATLDRVTDARTALDRYFVLAPDQRDDPELRALSQRLQPPPAPASPPPAALASMPTASLVSPAAALHVQPPAPKSASTPAVPVAAWVGLGTGIALAGTAFFLYWRADVDADALHKRCPTGCTAPGDVARIRSLETASFIAAGLAGISFAAAGAFAWRSQRRAAAEVRVGTTSVAVRWVY